MLRQAEDEVRERYLEKRRPLKEALLEWEEVLSSLVDGDVFVASGLKLQNSLLDRGWEVVEWAPLLATKPMTEKLVALTRQARDLRDKHENAGPDGLERVETGEAGMRDLEELGEQLRLVVGSSLALPLARL